jgi:HEAT repeat protein
MRTFLLTVWIPLFAPTGKTVPARYIDSAPTLGRIMKDAPDICSFEVEKVDHEKRVILCKKVSELKGAYSGARLHLQVPKDAPPFLLDWANPAKILVSFFSADVSVVCLGKEWYECSRTQGAWWSATRARPELSLAYFGSAEKLAGCIPEIQKAKEVVITTVVHGANGFGMYFDVAFRQALRGSHCRVQRIKAGLEMPADCWHIGKDPRWFVGWGPAGLQEIPSLIEALARKDPEARRDAAWALGLLGKEAREAASTLRDVTSRDSDGRVRISAAEALAKIDPSGLEGVSSLIGFLGEKDPLVRKAAAEALGNVGPEARTAVPKLIERLQDQDLGVRGVAAGSLGQIGPAAESAVQALADMLVDTRLREAAAEALGDIGPKAAPAARALVEGLKDNDSRYRWSVMGALVRIGGPSGKAAVPALIEALESGDTRSYYNATLFLSALGPEAKQAIPALLKRDDDLSSCALWSIDPKNGIRGYVLTSLTTDRTCDQWFAASHFEGMGPWRKEAAHAVAEALMDGRLTHVAEWAVDLILRGESESVLPVLVEALKMNEPAKRRRAATVLGQMGGSAKGAQPALSRALQDPQAEVRQAATEALKRIESTPSK